MSDLTVIRNSFITWASDFYGRNDMDIVRTLDFIDHLLNGDISKQNIA